MVVGDVVSTMGLVCGEVDTKSVVVVVVYCVLLFVYAQVEGEILLCGATGFVASCRMAFLHEQQRGLVSLEIGHLCV